MHESRVALTPDTAKRFANLGAEVLLEKSAGLRAGFLDADYEAAGAKIASRDEALSSADILVQVRRPSGDSVSKLKRNALILSTLDPYQHDKEIAYIAQTGVKAFAMELMPRITRAQAMDVLSSQANLAGYRAVIDAAAEYGRALPMMMTAAGTVPAARNFRDGRRRRRAAGDRHRAPPRRHRHRDRRAPGHQGAGGEPGRQVPRRSRTRSSRTRRRRAATPRRCRTPTGQNRPSLWQPTSPNRTS